MTALLLAAEHATSWPDVAMIAVFLSFTAFICWVMFK